MNLKVLRQFWIHVFLFLVILQTVSKCEQVSNDIISKSLNTKSDANLRRALLKALQELENEENVKDKNETSDDNYPEQEKTLQKARASIVSVITDSFGNSRSITATPSPSYVRYVTKAPQSIINNSNKDNISLHLSSKLKLDTEGDTESNLLTSASQNIVFSGIDNKISEQRIRSAINGGNNNLIVSSEKVPKKDTFRTYTSSTRSTHTTTTTSTTTTTVQPPTSSTEEHEAKVEDVQFFQAPLVAAFTVHQDEKGLPKKVEAIYKSSTEIPLDKQSKNEQLKKSFYAQQRQEIASLQLALQAKQEALKQQLLGLPNQDFLYRHQQLLREQQNQFSNEEKLKQLENKQPPAPPTLSLQTPIFPNPPNQFKNTQNIFNNNPAGVSIQQSISSVPSNDFFLPTVPPFSPTAPPLINNPLQLSSFSNIPQSQSQSISSNFNSGSGVSLTPSISSSYKEDSFFTGPTIYSQQQLPNKESVNFLGRSILPSLPGQNLSPILNTQLTPPVNTGVDSKFPLFNNNNRPLRSEGLNNVGIPLQNFNNNVAISQPNFRGNIDNNYRPIINNQLNHLLRQSGIAETKHAEDFNIVSKVLSLESPKYNALNGNNFNQPFYHTL